MRISSLVPLALLAAAGRAAGAAPITVVACAPGYPGSTAEAQPSMDAFALALAAAAGWPRAELEATYQETEKGGLARLEQPDAAVALVPLPFLARHGRALHLEPKLQVEEKGNGLEQVWTLVAKKGRVTAPGALATFTIASIAGYSPDFVRGALSGWGKLPDETRFAFSAAVLSSLRKAAAGDDVAVLLDASQTTALATLPFAPELEVVARSPPLPVAFACTVGSRLAPSRWSALAAGLEKLPGTPAGAAALEGIRMVRFVAPSPAALEALRRFAGPAPESKAGGKKPPQEKAAGKAKP